MTESKQGPMHMSNYKDDMTNWKDRVKYCTSNKSTMCSVVLGQCDPAIQAKLQMTKSWDANKRNLLFILKAAHAACIGVQDYFSLHVVKP